jgi:hypothetical protein
MIVKVIFVSLNCRFFLKIRNRHQKHRLLYEQSLRTIVLPLKPSISIVSLVQEQSRDEIFVQQEQNNEHEIDLDESSEEDEPKEYEDQTLDMFVPLEDRDDLGEVHIDFNTKDGIRAVHHVKEVRSQNEEQNKQESTTQNNLN